MAEHKAGFTADQTSDNGEVRKVQIGAEKGRSGLKEFGGVIREEELRQLRDPTRRRKVYREMRNDPVIGAVLFAIEMLIRGVEWTVQPVSEEEPDVEVATFFEGAIDDMSYSWADTIADILSFLWEGFAFAEVVYKFRQGDREGGEGSAFDDGKIGWRKVVVRPADTLDRWLFDASGGVAAFVQRTWDSQEDVIIPIEKALLFRTGVYKGNPEGESILRRAYSSWWNKRAIQKAEGIAIERELAGLPVAYCPHEWTITGSPNGDSYEELKTIVTNIKADEQAGIVLPSIYDQAGNQTLKLELLSTQGRRQIDTTAVIERYDQRLALIVLADFILLGSKGVGSLALSQTKTQMFVSAFGAWLKMIAGVFTSHAIPRLMRLNGMTAQAPNLVPGDLESPDLEKLAEFVSKLSGAGINFADLDTENMLRESAGMPLKAEEDEEEIPEDEFEVEDEVTAATKRLLKAMEAGR